MLKIHFLFGPIGFVSGSEFSLEFRRNSEYLKIFAKKFLL